jgi:threonylcarbamoyladenosine tRNA methylthiotransferase MtaB
LLFGEIDMKFGFFTLGCKTNQYETQAMERLFVARGHEIGSFDDICDGYIINTCSVTAVADKKNRAIIRRCRREREEAVIGVCGCYSQHDPESARNLGVDVIGGSADRENFVDMMIATALDRQKRQKLDEALRRREFEVLPAGSLEGRTRAMLKVQDGCRNFCSYCIIPYTRGPVRSAPLQLAVQQAKELADAGYREIVLTGIEIASWGVDLPEKPGPDQLIQAVCAAAPSCRVRLGSLEPRIITEEFVEKMAKLPNLCPQFHLSMQSGCDTVLARMKRKYDTARYLQSVEILKKHFPGCAITTDMIVAFPGETEEEFAESLAFIQKCGFADMHIFPYSRRPGTPADKMSGQHDNATKEARSRAAIAVATKMREEYRKNLIGSVQEVLFEEPEGEYFTGHAPNYVKVYVKGENLHNEIRDVKITGIYKDGLMGTLEQQKGEQNHGHRIYQ